MKLLDRVKWGPPLEVYLRAQYKLLHRSDQGEWRVLCIENATAEEYKEWLDAQLKVGTVIIEIEPSKFHRVEVKMELKTTTYTR